MILPQVETVGADDPELVEPLVLVMLQQLDAR